MNKKDVIFLIAFSALILFAVIIPSVWFSPPHDGLVGKIYKNISNPLPYVVYNFTFNLTLNSSDLSFHRIATSGNDLRFFAYENGSGEYEYCLDRECGGNFSNWSAGTGSLANFSTIFVKIANFSSGNNTIWIG